MQTWARKAFIFAAYFGSYPFYFSTDVSKYKKKGLAYTALMKILFGGVMMILLYQGPEVFANRIVPYAYILHTFLITTLFSFVFHFYQSHFFRLFSLSALSDHLFHRLKKKLYSRFSFFSSNLLLSFTLIHALITYLNHKNLVLIIGLVYVDWAFYSLVQPFVLVLDKTRMRFQVLRQMLTKTCLTERLDVRAKSKRLVSILSLYDVLCVFCEILNSCFSPQLLYVFSSLIAVITWHLFMVLVVINVEAGFLIILTHAIVVMRASLLTLMLTTACRRVSIEAERFNQTLYRLMICDNNNDLINNDKLHLHLAMKREVVFTACSFFTVDYTLLHSMIATTTTYLVILLQLVELH